MFLETETLLDLSKSIVFDINLKVFNAHSDFPDEAEFSPKAIVRNVMKQRSASEQQILSKGRCLSCNLARFALLLRYDR